MLYLKKCLLTAGKTKIYQSIPWPHFSDPVLAGMGEAVRATGVKGVEPKAPVHSEQIRKGWALIEGGGPEGLRGAWQLLGIREVGEGSSSALPLATSCMSSWLHCHQDAGGCPSPISSFGLFGTSDYTAVTYEMWLSIHGTSGISCTK